MVSVNIDFEKLKGMMNEDELATDVFKYREIISKLYKEVLTF